MTPLRENQPDLALQQKKQSEENSGNGQVMAPPQFGLKADPVQRKPEDEEESLQAKMGDGGGNGSFSPVQRKESSENGLPENVQGKMENSLGSDFSNVNIHENSNSASDMGALAYTQGNDVHFAPGQFKPDTRSGQELIGHELTHVVQQREGNIKPTTEVNGQGVNNDKGLEAEADSMGAKAARGEATQMKSSGNAGAGAVQRATEYQDYTVVSGDTLAKIAAKFGVTVDEIREANADKLKKWGNVEGFNAGEVIKIPVESVSPEPAVPEPTPEEEIASLGADYANGSIDMIALGKGVLPYVSTHGSVIIALIDQLPTNSRDNLCYVMASNSDDTALAAFDRSLLERMSSELGGYLNTTSWADNWAQQARIDAILGGAETDTGEKDEGETDQPADAGPVVLDPFTLAGDVGADTTGNPAENFAKDVKLVQAFLVSFSYLAATSGEIAAVQEVFNTNPDAKIPTGDLTETIAAIKEFQKKGATSTSAPDGQISKNGGSTTHAALLTNVQNKYGSEELLQEEKMVLTSDQFNTQARYGYNYYGKDEDTEKAYMAKIEELTGITDPADLYNAPQEQIDEIKNDPAFAIGSFYTHDDVKTYGIRKGDKGRASKPNWICCYDAAKKMLGKSGAVPDSNGRKIQTFFEENKKDGEFTNQVNLGLKYIDGQLKAGKAVFVGVDKDPDSTNNYNEGVTDHFVVIMGKGQDDAGWYYRYFDPGSSYKSSGTSTDNKFRISANLQSVTTDKYNLSQIRVNTEDGI
ncbi:MAG: DUF4157 domain-containing protein [Bacteroidia bacterium]|nr:DUF4157 domain-containing protein [Bacteroidia bacterium]